MNIIHNNIKGMWKLGVIADDNVDFDQAYLFRKKEL